MRGRCVSLLLSALAGCGSSLPWEVPGGASYTAVAVGDADRDGHPDLWFCNARPGELRIALRDGASPRGFLDGGGLRVGLAPRGLAVADLDRDGDLDALVTDFEDGMLRVVLQTGPGQFVEHARVSIGPRAYDVAVGNLNGDAWPDAAVGRGDGGVTVLLQDPDASGTFTASQVLGAGLSLVAVAICDVDDDGAEDLVATDMNRARVLLFLQDPDAPGTFLPGEALSTGTGPDGIVLRDLDGDGRPDLAVSDYSHDSASVLLQDPGEPGVYLAATDYPTGEYSAAVAAGDFDGDGRPDLALADSDVSRNVSLLLQDPAFPGRFLPGPKIEVGPGLQAVAVADFDGDGRDDIAVARGFFLPDLVGRVQVLFQDPDAPGGFTAPLVVR